MKLLQTIIMIALSLAAGSTFAQGDDLADMKPSFSASQSVTATARVEAVNHETREVTLLLEDGELLTSRVDDEVRNFDQVGVGDTVSAHYTESISIRVVAGDGSDPQSYVEEDMARSAAGKMPGIATTESVTSTAIVEDIDIENNTFTLRESDGETRQYTALNPGNLRRAKVGDKVITTVTTAVVVTVHKEAAE